MVQEWIDFYRPFFPSQGEVEKFVSVCEQLASPSNTAKILMHQAQRLVALADDIDTIRPKDEPLKVLFLTMCAENIAKLHDGYSGDGQSRAYVRKFFNDFLCQADKDKLGYGFLDGNNHLMRPLGFDRVVDMLYDIRCDVVHEGNYSDFAFHNGLFPVENTNPKVTADLRFPEVRDVVVRGCIKAVWSKIPTP
jgi:hypothetical protein